MSDLYPHQEPELAFLLATPRALLLSEMGTGKTPVLLRYAGSVLAAGGRVLWVTEKGLVRQAIEEAATWLPEGSMLPVDLDKAKPVDRFLITTHGTAPKRMDVLSGTGFDLLIVDEATIVGGGGIVADAVAYRALRELSERSTRTVFATATPVSTTHGLDLWALMDAAGIPGTPTRQYISRHLICMQAPNSWGGTIDVPDGITDLGLALLTEPLRSFSIRTTVGQTGQAMPRLRRTFIDVPLTWEDGNAYAQASDLSGLQGHQHRQSASRSVSALVPALKRYLTDGEGAQHRKMIVFTENFDLFDPIVSMLTGLGMKVRTITGNMTAKQRHVAVEEHKAMHQGVLVGTGAVETGLNLQYVGLLVSVVQSWSPAREAQREGRLVRIGSEHDEVLHTIIRPDVSIEIRKDRKHDRKQGMADRVLSVVPSSLAWLGAVA